MRARFFAAAALLAVRPVCADDLSAAPRLRATLYAPGSSRAAVLFHWHLTGDAEGNLQSRFLTPEGALAADDQLLHKDGAFQRYSYTRHNIDERASAERRGDKIAFSQTWRGQTRQRQEDWADNFVAGPLVVPYIQEHWSALAGGRELSIRYGVLDQLRSFEFKLDVDAHHPQAGPDRTVVRMRAASFLVRLFVDPIYFLFSADGRALHAIAGRTLPVRLRDGEPVAVDAEMVFH